MIWSPYAVTISCCWYTSSPEVPPWLDAWDWLPRYRVSHSFTLWMRLPNGILSIDAMELSADAYHKGGADKSFTVLQTSEQMVRFVILDVELCHLLHSTSDSNKENGM